MKPLNSETIYVNKVGEDDTVIADFSSQKLRNLNYGHFSRFVVKDGISAYAYPLYQDVVELALPRCVDITGCHTVAFSVYSEKKSPTRIGIYLPNCAAPITVELNFEGWKSIEVLHDAITVKDPMPLICGVKIKRETPSENGTVWISDIKAHKYNFELVVPDGVDISSPKIYDDIIEKFREYYLGTDAEKDMPEYRKRVEGRNENTKKYWKMFKDTYYDGITNGLYGINIDIPAPHNSTYTRWDESKIRDMYVCISIMAGAYATEGTDYYGNKELLADVKKALEYAYENFYGPYMLENGNIGDWYQWDIGNAQQLVRIFINLTAVEGSITQEEIAKYLEPFNRIMPFPVGSGMNMCYMADNCILAGALMRDAKRIAVAEYFLMKNLEYITVDKLGAGTDGGYFKDGSFIQHIVTPYAGSYGLCFMKEIPPIVYRLEGTHFALRRDLVNNFYNWAFDTYQPIMYGTNLMSNTFGRNLSSEKSAYDSAVMAMILMVKYVPKEIEGRYKSLVRTFMHRAGTDYTDTGLIVPIFVKIARELYNDDSVKLIDDYRITKVLGNSARVYNHTASYGAGLSLSTSGITKYESINGANFTGWYLSDGMLYIYTDDYEFGSDFYAYANPYLMPATTVNSSERYVGNIHPTIPNASDFAGGVEHGEIGAAGFVLGYNKATLRGTFVDAENGYKIRANKSYFMFDKEIVCVGSNIKDMSGTEVRTVVENRFWRENDKLCINGELVEAPAANEYVTAKKTNMSWGGVRHPASSFLKSSYRSTVQNAKNMYFSNMGGYVFFDNENELSYTKLTVTGNTETGTIANTSAKESRTFLEITLAHGTGNESLNGSYSYAYLPKATAEETAQYSESPDVVILKKADNVHAVYKKSLNAVGAVFYAPENVDIEEKGAPVCKIKSDFTGAIMISVNKDGELLVSVSDPTAHLEKLSFEIEMAKKYDIVSADEKVKAEINGKVLRVSVDSEGSCGGSFHLTLK